MPLFATLVNALFAKAYAFALAIATGKIAARYAVVTALVAMYVAAVALFNGLISPLLGSLFATSYGQVIGLAFPPIAGTVLTGYFMLWSALVGYRYVRSLSQIAIPG